MYHRDHFLALPDDVIAFAWSAPMRELSARVGISDVGLRKLLNAQGIATPPRGHWNRVRAGRRVPAPPVPRPRGPGESRRVRLDGRFRDHVAEAGPLPADGPFASPRVPENLAVLRHDEFEAIGRVAAPRDLKRPHPGLARLLSKELARREKAAASGWHWDEPHFDTPLGKRQLRLLGGIFRALAGRGYESEAWEEEGSLMADCTIGDTRLALHFTIPGRHRTFMRGGRQLPARDLPATTPLRLALKRTLRAQVRTAWEDAPDQPLEKQLATIAADLIVAGEAAFRQGLVEAAEFSAKVRQWEEEKHRKHIEELARQRQASLELSGALLCQAEDLRALVLRVGAAVQGGQLYLGDAELAAWREWALGRADELDPVLSGQVLEHIRPADAE